MRNAHPKRGPLTIIKMEPLPGWKLRLMLSSGAIVVRDLVLLAVTAKGVLTRLRDPKYFQRARLVHGAPTWPGEVDFSPQTMIWDECPNPTRPGRPALERVVTPTSSSLYRERLRAGVWHVTVCFPDASVGRAGAKSLITARRRASEWARVRLGLMNNDGKS